MTIIYVIGPSGAGKSSLCRALAEANTSLTYVDLDDAIKKRSGLAHVSLVLTTQGSYKFWLYSLAIFNDLNRKIPKLDYLVDVGAGSLEAPESRTYFKEHNQQVLCVWGTPEAVWERKYKQQGWTVERLMEIEYAPKRTELYDAIPYRIDTSNQLIDDELIQCQQTLLNMKSNL